MYKLLTFLMLVIPTLAFTQEQIKLTPNNTVTLNDVVYQESVSKVITELSALEGNEEPVIYLVLDTPGGSVFAGLQLIDYLKGYSKPVKTITYFAASMGFQIANGNKGDRLITDTGVLMSHPMSGGLRGELGNGFSVDNQHDFLKQIIETMDDAVVKRSNGKVTLEQYKKAYDNELWITGKMAVNAGYADSVVSTSCDRGLVESTNINEFRDYLGGSSSGLFAIDVKMEIGKCPQSSDLRKYQIAIVELLTNKKFVIINKGYDIPESANDSFLFLKRRSKVGDEDIMDIVTNSLAYKKLQFYLNRDKTLIRELNWL